LRSIPKSDSFPVETERSGEGLALTLFRPCIDLHSGAVKQIIGGTLGDAPDAPATNFVSEQSAGYYSALYRRDDLRGGHIVMLGPGNEQAATEALAGWPGGMQLGGGITPSNAAKWLDLGAEKLIVTSWLFEGGRLSSARLQALAATVPKKSLVIDLSCRRRGDSWFVATERWRVVTDTEISAQTLDELSSYCSEFLVHAADVEGLQGGIDEPLVELLGRSCPLPCTYAGGGRALRDLDRVEVLSGGRVDLTFGSALDLFGGSGVRYADCVRYNREAAATRQPLK
jgi:phosphoribosylformimino-5-aminoimidazole carboxamide ribotide isomerase